MGFSSRGAAFAAALSLAGCASAPIIQGSPSLATRYAVKRPGAGEKPNTLASYYDEGARTAAGDRFVPNGLTAAHRTLPFGTRVRVTNVSNSRAITVRINDRGPFVKNRSIDLSYGAAAAIGMTQAGVARVRMEVLP
jgi:rare lipoprotein A